jgi:hypothetical protein
VAFAHVPGGGAGPLDAIERLHLVERRLGEEGEHLAQPGFFRRDRGLVGRRNHFAALDVDEGFPEIGGLVETDRECGDGVELARGVDEDVADEIERIGIARELGQVGPQERVGPRRGREPVFGGELAFAPHGLDQALAMQGGADQSGGDFERGYDRGIEFTDALPVVEADDADVFAVDEDRHDGRGARLVAGDAHALDGARRIRAEHDALSGHEHGAELIGARFVPRVRAVAGAHGAGVGQ